MIENRACHWGGILCRFIIKIMPSILILLLCFLLTKAPLHLHSSPMDSVLAIDYVPTLHERLNFLRKASATTLSVLVSSILELWTCLPQEYLWELTGQYVFKALLYARLLLKGELYLERCSR